MTYVKDMRGNWVSIINETERNERNAYATAHANAIYERERARAERERAKRYNW